MDKTIVVCPNCGRLKYWPDVSCLHCSCVMVNYKRWTSADEKGKKKILSEYKQPSTYHPIEGHQDLLDKDDKTDAQIRKELTEEQERAKYTPKCPVCGCPDLEKIGTGEKIASAAFWGLLAKKPKCQFRCKGCGYEF